jgi:hypothetical protein
MSRVYKPKDLSTLGDFTRGKGELAPKTGTVRSIFDLGSHRHNLHTLSHSISSHPYQRPAGIPKHGRDQTNNLASVFLKQNDSETQKLASSLFMHRRHSKS